MNSFKMFVNTLNFIKQKIFLSLQNSQNFDKFNIYSNYIDLYYFDY